MSTKSCMPVTIRTSGTSAMSAQKGKLKLSASKRTIAVTVNVSAAIQRTGCSFGGLFAALNMATKANAPIQRIVVLRLAHVHSCTSDSSQAQSTVYATINRKGPTPLGARNARTRARKEPPTPSKAQNPNRAAHPKRVAIERKTVGYGKRV